MKCIITFKPRNKKEWVLYSSRLLSKNQVFKKVKKYKEDDKKNPTVVKGKYKAYKLKEVKK